jgi:NAD(P)-dependent dehydrogenase (short-subunit alcohol dehydrogenase family)
MRVCIVGASGKLGRYLVQHALDRGYDVVGVCREQSVGKLDVFKTLVGVGGWLGRITRFADLDDQVEACRRVFASDTRWTVVRGSDLEEGESQGLPVWSRHVGDPILESNLTRRIDFALFMVEALESDGLVHEAPAIVGRRTPSGFAHAGD